MLLHCSARRHHICKMSAEAGTVLIDFSPGEEFRRLTEIAEKNFARMEKKKGRSRTSR